MSKVKKEVEQDLMGLFKRYTLDNISVDEYLDTLHHFFNLDTTGIPTQIDEFMNNIADDLLSPLLERLDEVQEKMKKYYEELFLRLLKLKPFFRKFHFSNMSQYASIMRSPFPNLEHPDKYLTSLPAHRKPTEAEDKESFFHTTLPGLMKKGVTQYCEILQEIIDETKKDLDTMRGKILPIANTVRDAHSKFKKVSAMETSFVTLVLYLANKMNTTFEIYY